MGQYSAEIKRRRTFAIISHPDAGKTTLTEKLLLFGGAIHVAGAPRGGSCKIEQDKEDGDIRLDGDREATWYLGGYFRHGIRLCRP